MALTITNTNAQTLLNIVNANSAAQAKTTKQLATGKRINVGADDPAGLIALTNFQTEIRANMAVLDNNLRSDAMLNVADAALGEISSLLSEIETLVLASTSAAGTSAAEISANQAQIDNLLAAIDQIVSTSSFNGKKLLDGSFGIQTAGVTGNSNLSNLRVFSRSNATSDTALTVTRAASAQLASATFAFAGSGAATSGTTEVVIQGSLGAATITLTSGLTQAQIVSAINAAKDQTGVSAIQAATNIKLSSSDFGKDAFISVEVLSGGVINGSYGTSTGDGDTANDIQNASKVTGQDATITINGQTASTDGLDVYFNSNGLSLAFTLSSEFGGGSTAGTTTSFTVKAAGGATFQLGTTANTKQTIGIDSLASFALGGANGSKRLSEVRSGGGASLSTDTTEALKAVRAAISEVAEARGRIGGFQKFQIGSAINSLKSNKIGLEAAASVIGDTDYAVASSNLNKQSVLLQTSFSLMGIANQQSAQILALLG